MSDKPLLLTITPNNPNPVPTERYVRLLVVMTTALLVVGCAVLLERALSLIHHTVLLFALGGLLAYAVDPIVEWVRGRHLPSKGDVPRKQAPRWLGVVAVFVTVTLAFALTIFLVGSRVVREAQVLTRDKDKLQAQETQKVADLDTYLHQHGVPPTLSLSDTIQHPPDSVKEFGAKVGHASLSVASDFSRDLAEGVVVILIAIYLLLFSEELKRGGANLFPPHIRPYISDWQDEVNRILGGFVRGQTILGISLGLAATVACALLGLRFWALIGLFVAIVSLIPVIGPYIGAIPAVLSALVSQNSWIHNPGARVAAILVLFVILNEFGSKVIYPKLVGKALRLHEVVVLFALLAGLEVGGIVGTLFAAPLTALTIATVHQLYRLWLGLPSPPNPAIVITENGEGPLPSVNSAVIVDQTDGALPASPESAAVITAVQVEQVAAKANADR